MIDIFCNISEYFECVMSSKQGSSAGVGSGVDLKVE